MITVQKLAAEKAACIKRITKRIKPHLWKSGFVTGPIGSHRPYELWVLLVQGVRRTWRLHGLAIDRIEGIAEDGVITDSHGAGCVTTPFVALSLEDLMRVERWTIKMFSEAAA